MARLSIRLFGSPQMTLYGERVADLRSDKAWALLAYLAVERESPQRREKLAGLLWPGYTEASARTNLRRALADLRLAMGDRSPLDDLPEPAEPGSQAPYFLVTRQTLQLDPTADLYVDVSAFMAALHPARARGEMPPACLEEAIALYRGPFLDGFSIADSPEFEEWAVIVRERFHREVLDALHRLASGCLAQGEHEAALRYAWQQLELDPWQEEAHRQVMQALMVGGQRGAALAQYEACRSLLRTELKVEPSPQTQELYESLLKGTWPTASTVPAPAAPSARPPGAPAACPFRALAAFREQDAGFFFGREDFGARLSEAVSQQPVAVVVGPSGSGKSSVVFAGLLPRLNGTASREWLTAAIRPSAQPFLSLAAALLPLLEPAADETGRLVEIQKLAGALQQGEAVFAQVIQRVVEKQAAREQGRFQDRGLLLVVDQLEELYTLCAEPERKAFVDGLLAAAAVDRRDTPAFRLVLTLRGDFMGQALAYRPFADVLQKAALMLGPMTRDELRAAIEKPAAKAGATFEPGLVERILDDVGEEPGNLPLLEFALTLLWEGRAAGLLTHAEYEGIGQVQGALARHAEQVISRLDRARQEGARQVFVQLVQPGGGTEDTRRVAMRAEIGEANWPLVQRLADNRLVVTGRETGAGRETVELAHEALIKNWPRLRDWLDADRAFRTWQEGLRAVLRQWQASGRDESALLRGVPLDSAENWLAARPADLSEEERAFVRAGGALRGRQAAEQEARRQTELAVARRGRRQLALLVGVLAVTTLIAIGLTAFSAQQRRQAVESYSVSVAASAQKALDDRDTGTALALALAASQIDPAPQAVQRVLMEAAYSPGPRRRATVTAGFPGITGTLTALARHEPAGEGSAASGKGEMALLGLADGRLLLWDVAAATAIRDWQAHGGRLNSVAFAPGGAQAVSGGDDGQVILWDLATGHEVRRFRGHAGAVRAVAISPDGRLAASGGFTGGDMLTPGELILWDLATGAEVRRFAGHVSGVVRAAFTPDGKTILASSGDALLMSDRGSSTMTTEGQGRAFFDLILWDVAGGEALKRFPLGADDVYSLAISPDGGRGLTGSYYNNQAALWDLATGERLRTFTGHQQAVNAVAFSPDGRTILTGSEDGHVIQWDAAGGQQLVDFAIHSGGVVDLAAGAGGRSAVSAARDGELILWDLGDAAEVRRLQGHGDMVWDVAITADGKQALSASGAAALGQPGTDTSIRLWALAEGKQLRAQTFPLDVIFQVALSPDGRTALLAGNDQLLRVWDVETWQTGGALPGHGGWITGVEYAPDGRRAVSSSVDGTLIVWDIAVKKAVRRLAAGGPLWGLAISPDGQTALSDAGGQADGSTMILWNLEDGEEIRRFRRSDASQGQKGTGSSGMAFLPGGRRALSVDDEGLLIEWDLATGREIRRLGTHKSLRTRVVVSPDGRLALTSGMDGSLLLWDLERGQLVRRSAGHGVIFDLTLSPDGQTAYFGSSDRSVVQWQLLNPSPAQLQSWVAGNRFVRPLSCAERALYRVEPLCP